MKKVLTAALAALLIAPSFISRADDEFDLGNVTRIDFLNVNGKRMFSEYAQPQAVFFQVNQDPDEKDKLNVVSSQAVKITDIQFVQWGTESYPLNLSTDNSKGDIKVEILPDTEANKEARKFRTASETETLKCGTSFTLAITMPEGQIPEISFTRDYTYPDMDIELSSFGPNIYRSNWPLFRNFYYWNPENRKELLTQFDSTGYFVHDKENPNRWIFEYAMPNEPITMKIYPARRNAEWLDQFLEYNSNLMYSYNPDGSGSPIADCGDPYTATVLGDYYSGDMVPGYMNASQGWADSERLHTTANTYVCTVPWKNAFALINSSNALLKVLDCFDLSEAELANAMAECLTYRAYGYLRLLQVYGKRWSDSENGSAYCAPLYTEFTDENLPLATMKQIADQCYADLNEAIGAFTANSFERKNISRPDADVARAVLVRLAMLREDWNTAKINAEAILADKPLTHNDELTGGFLTVTPSWIWGSEASLGYWQPQAYYGCNGAYPSLWDMGCNAIDVDLYRSMQEYDVRRKLFALPPNITGPYKSWSNWYSSKMSETLTVDGKFIAPNYEVDKPEKADGAAFRSYGDYYPPVQFGSQVKFYMGNLFEDGGSPTLFIRTDEMLLSEAEACFHLGDETRALALLNTLNQPRTGVASNAKGEALLEEIRLTRRIELWGEGHSWFDFKRWNLPIKRHIWAEGDETSGNWPAIWQQYTEEPTGTSNGFRCVIPKRAVDYNPLIDISLMGYTKASGYESAEAAPAATKAANKINRTAKSTKSETPLRLNGSVYMP